MTKQEPVPPITESAKTDQDLEKLLALWATVTPEAKRIFGEVALCIDGWPRAKEITEAEAMDGKRRSRE
jgi:hypothetical protein